jgi:hypothetical protein
LEHALRAFAPDDEASFASATAEFLSNGLLQEISGRTQPSQDLILSSLSGNQQPRQILYGGKRLVLDSAGQRLRRMQQTIQSQSYTPMATLLEIYKLIERIQSSSDTMLGSEGLRLLSERLNRIRTVEWTPAEPRNSSNPVAQVPIEQLKSRIESAISGMEGKDTPATCAREIAAQLHAELGITLLAYCYAYGETPDLDILAFDPNFVQKHRFYATLHVTGFQNKPAWVYCRFKQEEQIGG